MSLALSVHDLGGLACTLSAEPTWKVLRVKQTLKTSFGIPVSEQRLIIGTTELKNTQLLCEYFSNDACVSFTADLTLVRRPPEQAKWLRRVRLDAASLRGAPDCVKADREVVEIALQHNAQLLHFASPELCADPMLVAAAVSNCPNALQYAAKELKSDRNFILGLLSNTVMDELDSIMQWKLVATYGQTEGFREEILNFMMSCRTNERMQNNTQRRRTCILEYVDRDLLADQEILFAALDRDARAREYIPAELWSDHNFIQAWSAKVASSLHLVDSKLWSNPELVFSAITRNWRILDFAPVQACSHPELVLATLANDWEVVHAAANVCADGMFLWKEAETMLNAEPILEFASTELQGDRDFVLAAVAEHGAELRHAVEDFRDDREVVLAAVTKNGLALEFAATEFRKDIEVVRAAVSSDGRALRFVDAELHSPELVMQAVSTDSRALKLYAAERLKNPEFAYPAAFNFMVEYAITLRSQAFQCFWMSDTMDHCA